MLVFASSFRAYTQEFTGFNNLKLYNRVSQILNANPNLRYFFLTNDSNKKRFKKDKSVITSQPFSFDGNFLLRVDTADDVNVPLRPESQFAMQFIKMPNVKIFYLDIYTFANETLQDVYIFEMDSNIVFIDCGRPSANLIEAIEKKYQPSNSTFENDTLPCVYKLTGVRDDKYYTTKTDDWRFSQTQSHYVLKPHYNENCELVYSDNYIRIFDNDFKKQMENYLVEQAKKSIDKQQKKINDLQNNL